MSSRYITALALWLSMTAVVCGQQTSDVLKDEAVPDLNGKLVESQRTVTHESTANGSKEVVTETYSSFIPGVALEFEGPLQLAQRVRITTTPMANGGRQTITETEMRVPGVTEVVMHLVARKVETVRQIAPGVWQTQRQTFRLDLNRRWVLTGDAKETAVDK